LRLYRDLNALESQVSTALGEAYNKANPDCPECIKLIQALENRWEREGNRVQREILQSNSASDAQGAGIAAYSKNIPLMKSFLNQVQSVSSNSNQFLCGKCEPQRLTNLERRVIEQTGINPSNDEELNKLMRAYESIGQIYNSLIDTKGFQWEQMEKDLFLWTKVLYQTNNDEIRGMLLADAVLLYIKNPTPAIVHIAAAKIPFPAKSPAKEILNNVIAESTKDGYIKQVNKKFYPGVLSGKIPPEDVYEYWKGIR
ncbi:MAG: hypothetical protein LUH04_10710, partial [Clostridium sp.]|nr:hypothetical protein [Clostridium sp.]